MLTPQEVSERVFSKVSFGGYNMGQVDEFLDILTEDYSALYNENAVLKNKMKVLVEKVEEYRSTEEAMRRALMTAQRMADELVQNAEEKKLQVIAEAEDLARNKTEGVRQAVEAEEFRLSMAKSATAAYVAKVRALHEQEVAYLEQLRELAPEPAPQLDMVDAAAAEIDDNVQRLLAQAMMDVDFGSMDKVEESAQAVAASKGEAGDLEDTAEFPAVTQQPEEEMEDEASQTRRIDFGNLQFGRDYEIK